MFWKFEIVTDLLCRSKDHPFHGLRRSNHLWRVHQHHNWIFHSSQMRNLFLLLARGTRWPIKTHLSLFQQLANQRCRLDADLFTCRQMGLSCKRQWTGRISPHFTQFMGWMLQKVFSYSQWSSGKWFFPILNESVLNWIEGAVHSIGIKLWFLLN